MKTNTLLFSLLALLSVACTHKATFPVTPRKAALWLTTGDGATRMQPAGQLLFSSAADAALPQIEIDEKTVYQSILGFGATMTGSSAHVLTKNLSEQDRRKVMQNLFSKENGIGLSYLRMTIGASDFSSHNYSYDDPPAGESDPQLRHFSIEEDRDDVIPRLKEAFEINPGIELMGSPWSAPAFMKTTGNMVKGRLKPGMEPVLADYFVRYVQAYAREGIRVSAITIQNEPEFEPPGYPGMLMSAEEQRDFIKNHLGPAFKQHRIGAKIAVYDHNWDHPEYPLTILDDPQARQYVDGAAFHCYGGEVANQSKVHDAYPDKNLYFTECSGGGWSGPWKDDLMWKFKNLIIGNLRNWSSCILLWNLALDEKSGPVNGGCSDCRGVVTARSDGTVDYTIDYYSLAHVSRFVRTGARRIASTDLSAQNLDNVAFKNPDGSKVLIAMNGNDTARSVQVKTPEGILSVDIPASSVISLTW